MGVGTLPQLDNEYPVRLIVIDSYVVPEAADLTQPVVTADQVSDELIPPPGDSTQPASVDEGHAVTIVGKPAFRHRLDSRSLTGTEHHASHTPRLFTGCLRNVQACLRNPHLTKKQRHLSDG